MYNKRWKTCSYCLWFIHKNEHPDILEDKYERYSVEDIVDWFISRVNCYNKLFEGLFEINFPLNEDTITPFTTECFYCRENLGNDIDRNCDHLNGKFRGYAYNKCNLQAKNKFALIYAFNSTNYDNHLFITKLAKKIRLKISTKTD